MSGREHRDAVADEREELRQRFRVVERRLVHFAVPMAVPPSTPREEPNSSQVLWLIVIGAFLTGVAVGRWAFLLLIPLALWIQSGPLGDDIELWITFVIAAALTIGVVVRWFARR